MKIKDGFVLKEISGSYVVVPVGENLVDFNWMVTLNETGAFLWNTLREGKTEDELVSAMTAEYDIDRETASKDIAEFLSALDEKQVLEK